MEIVDIILSLIAFSALVVSGASFWVAKKSYNLSAEQAAQKRPKLKLYLSDSFFQNIEEERLFVYSFTISNPADIGNAIANCELKITFKRSNGSFGNFLVQHDKNLFNKIPSADMIAMDIPAAINAHSSHAATTIFSVDLSILGDMPIEKYEIIFLDSHGLKIIETVFIMQEMVNE